MLLDAPVAYPNDYIGLEQTEQAMHDHVDDILDPGELSAIDYAESLVTALDEDWGEPGINFDYQLRLIGALHWIPRMDGASDPEALAEVVRSGLLAFYSRMSRQSSISERKDGSAVLYINLAAAMQSASRIARPNGDRAVSDAVVQITGDHSAYHPLGGTGLLADFLNEPGDVIIAEKYLAETAGEFGEGVALVLGDDPPIVIPICPFDYIDCVADCSSNCDGNWFQRIGCGLGCLAQCLPEIICIET